eukprot:CAMPEP_0197439488 /NCGR_PEP_ID=MMETSP1175-20131217/6218_1 /TAXON_ID=1003142 /ORGANISM="Triceratium dubium, Strain CCMP147" /LENGTH=304 /DNA_ID=CAMNT_0042969413 /DNA_START=406 /DNA_END=1320 /DNA_ORIENTATION=+
MERVKLLASVDFVWETLERGHVPWEVRYQQLLSYKGKHGDCLVPIGYKMVPQLSNWVSSQRYEMKMLKKGRPTRLTQERIAMLNSAGFVWEVQRSSMKNKKRGSSLLNTAPILKKPKQSSFPFVPTERNACPITQPAVRRVTADSTSFSVSSDAAKCSEIIVDSCQGIGLYFNEPKPAHKVAPSLVGRMALESRITKMPLQTTRHEELSLPPIFGRSTECPFDDRFGDAEEEQSDGSNSARTFDDRFADAEEQFQSSNNAKAIEEYFNAKRRTSRHIITATTGSPTTSPRMEEAVAGLLFIGSA